MTVNWVAVATIAAPIFALVAGVWIDRLLGDRPRVITYLFHATAIEARPTDRPPFQVHTHSVVVRNAGRKSATNLRLGHAYLPDWSVYPAVTYEVNNLPGGGKELLFPVLVPKEQLTVSYLYYSPVTWQQINTYTKTDQGQARVINALPTPQPSKWLVRLVTLFTLFGIVALIYVLVHLVGGLR